ncbi:MAG TPA: nucleotidyltransferase domain-containing protein [Bacillota bacterium]|nr:nucleotidyltransferase domain-containing protein [Bacillota bacterium]
MNSLNPNNFNQEKYQNLLHICAENKIGLVYFFGSQLDNALKLLAGENITLEDPLTDIDLGVVFLDEIESLPLRHRLYTRIYNSLEDLFTPYRLDLVFLQENHSVFQIEALKGICIFSNSEQFREDYEMSILRRAADFRYVLNKYTEEVLERY